MNMGSTPLNEALATMIEIVPAFKKKYNIEKMSLITLTDGAGDSDSSGVVTDTGQTYENGNKMMTSNKDGHVLVVKHKGKHYLSDNKSAYWSSDKMTGTLLEILRTKYDITTIGFYLMNKLARRNLNWAGLREYDRRGRYCGADYDTAMKSLRKDNCYATDKYGYDEYLK